MLKSSPQSVPIKRNLKIGDLEAETDKDMLLRCFVDNGTLSPLLDVVLPESIIIGRTGSGKSALLIALSERVERCRFLDPHNIAIRFLEHSDIIQFFTALGVNLDLFYRLLWRHVIVVELLRLHYEIRNQPESKRITSILSRLVERDPVKKEALRYFREWSDKFWIDTDERIREITEKLSNDIKAGFGASLAGVNLSLKGATSLSTEQRAEITNRAKRVVNELQIKKLSDLIDLLGEQIFQDKQKHYFILIDKLDENWAETETRLRFIRALIEEIKTFRKIKSVKIIIALRSDLLDAVFEKTRDSGFQQEKYESYIVPLQWTKNDLGEIVEKRINDVYKNQYTRIGVRFEDIFPSPRGIKKQPSFDYLIERTLFRPRDIMQFVNECLTIAVNRERVSWSSVSGAESIYSQKRLKSLFEEWRDIYPCLETYIELLRGQPETITRSDLSGDKLNKVTSELLTEDNDPCVIAIRNYCEPGKNSYSEADVVAEFVACFYKIGAIGVKISEAEGFWWSDYDHAVLSKSEARRVNAMKIHKMLHRVLGIRLPTG